MQKQTKVMGVEIFAFGVALASIVLMIVTLYFSHMNGGVIVHAPFGEAPLEIVMLGLGLLAVIWSFARKAGHFINGRHI